MTELKTDKVHKELDKFVSKNPALQEAMRVFDISMEQYRKAFFGYTNPQVFTSNSTNEFTLSTPDASQ